MVLNLNIFSAPHPLGNIFYVIVNLEEIWLWEYISKLPKIDLCIIDNLQLGKTKQ